MLLALHREDGRTDEQADGAVVDVRIEHLAVAEDAVDGVEGHGGIEMLGHHRFGRLGPVHDTAVEDAGFPPFLREQRIRVTKEVERLVGRDVLHWAFHR